MRDMFRRIAALLLTVVLLVSVCPMGLADGELTEEAGTEQTEAPTEPSADAPAEVPEVPEVPETTAEPTETPAEPTETPEVPEVPTEPAEPTETPPEPGATEEPEATAAPSEAAAAVQALLDGLPAAEAVQAMGPEEQQAAYAQVQAAYDAYMALDQEEKALLPAAEGVFTALFDFFNSGIVPAADVLSNVPVYDPRSGQTQQVLYAEVVAEDSAAWCADNGTDTNGWYVVAGNVTITERITVTGSVNLVLGNNAVLTARQGIGLADGAALTIWEQPQQQGTEGYAAPGTLIATASGNGKPGIGGHSCTVNIMGGRVTASASGYSAAGIGGDFNSRAVTVEIYGGTVKAAGGYTLPGIGGHLAGTVRIHGGTVTATGGGSGAGIGGGADFSSATVEIDGGTVTATGGKFAAGIGNGLQGGATTVTITGGTVTAYGGETIYPGQYGAGITGTVVITGGSVRSSMVQPTDGNGNNVYLIPVENPDGASVDVNGTTWNAVNHRAAGDGDDSLYLWLPGPRNVVTVAGGAPHTYIFDTEMNGFKEGEGAYYYDPASKETKFVQAAALTGTESELTGGWYVLRGAAGIDAAGEPLTVSGDVKLILTDGCVLDVPNGINIAGGGSLHIYGESGDTARDGALTAPFITSGSNSLLIDSGKLTVSGGTVTVSGSVRVDTLTVDGGILTVGDEITAADSVTISGGVVTANRLCPLTESGGVEITGGSVKVNEMPTDPYDGSGVPVHLLVVANNGRQVTVNGNVWNGTGHSDGNLYMYVPGDKVTVSVGGEAEVTYTWSGSAFYATVQTGYYDPDGKGTKQTEAWLLTSADTAWTTGWYVVQGSVEMSGRVTVSGNVDLILADGATLNAPTGIAVTEGNSLTIWGQSENYETNGKLTAASEVWNRWESAAPIGSNSFAVCGDITINGGVIEANGNGNDSPGIGGYVAGYYLHRGGDVTINGGVVTAKSLNYTGAGIGGDADVTINGGMVTATASSEGAAIGGAKWCVVDVVINGGVVTATAGNGGAAIGTGYGVSGTVTINGGTVTATAGNEGAAIGGGNDSVSGTVTITGGTVNATAGNHGAGIGGGNGSNGGTGNVTITGGTVNATGGRYGAAIGGGKDGSGNVTIEGGTVTATGSDKGADIGGGSGGSGNVTIEGGVVKTGRLCSGTRSNVVDSSLTITGGTVTAANGYTSGSTVIQGGSVKGRMSGQPTDGTQNVYLLTVPNPSGGPITVGGRSWSPTSHAALESGDTDLYAYVPGEDQTVVVDGVTKIYTFDPDTNTFTCQDDYDWANGTWTWAENSKSATFTVPCKDSSKPGLSWRVLSSVKAETTATCTAPGTKTYTASVTVLGRTYTAPEEPVVVTTPATGHSWDYEGETARRTLSPDGRTVTVYCLNDETHTQTARLDEKEDTEAYQAPNCKDGVPGKRFYDRTFTMDGETYTYDRLEVPIPAEHKWGPWEPAAETEATYVSARKCTVCGEEEISNHWHKWNLPAQDDKDNVKWVLGPDEYYVTVNVTCGETGCQYHDTPMQVLIDAGEIHASQTKAATCTDNGEVVYEVTLTLAQEGGSVSETYYSAPRALPAVGHDWGTPEFSFTLAPGADLTPQESWAPGEYCTMTLTCTTCGAKTGPVPAESIEGVVTKAPTCDVTGEAEVTATASYEGVTYESAPQARVAPATGHCWNSAVVTWTESDFGHAEVTFTCANDPSHTEKVEVATTSREITPAACTEPGRVEYTADVMAAAKAAGVEYIGSISTFTHTDSIPATGHAWNTEYVTAGVDGDRTTVTVYCDNDPAHSQTVYTELKKTDSQQATCAKEGSETYQMTYHVDGVEGEQQFASMTYPIPKCPHKWGDWVEQPATAQGVTTWKRTCPVCGAEETEDHKHTYAFPAEAQWSFADNGDVLSAAVVLTCDNGEQEVLTYSGRDISSRVIRPAGCTEPGQVEYTVTATVDGKSKTYTKTVPIPATGHIWYFEDSEVTWSPDYSQATFTFECISCHEKRTVTVPAAATVIREATCEDDGEMLYTAEVTLEGTYASVQQGGVAIPATGHDWDVTGEDIPLGYGVEGDFTTVTITCRSDHSHTRTAYASLTLVKEKCVKAKCETPGKDVYQMTYTVDGETYPLGNAVEYPIPALGHLWGSDHKCSRCGAAEPFSGEHHWYLPEPEDTARVQWSQTETGMRPYLTVTAVCVDENGEMITTQNIVVAGDDITVTTERDCEDPGRTVYSATVELDGESETYTRAVADVAPTGHWWGVDEDDIKWSSDGNEVTFHFHCKWPWGTGHTADVTAAVERTIVEPTCTEDGQVLLSAAAQMGGATATAQKPGEIIPALGHDFHDGVCSRCGAKDPNYAPAPTPAGTSGNGGTGSGKAAAPDTGDEAALLPWTALLLACAGALALLIRRRRPDGRNR